MIHVVTHANRSAYAAQIDEMHRLRWNYYIRDRQWRELRELQDEEGYERDCYDDARAVYLMSLDAAGKLAGAIRLRRTDRPTLISDRYWHLIDEPENLDLGPDIWEITRVIRTPQNRVKDGAVRGALHAGMVELALMRGVRRLVGVCDTFMLPGIISLWQRNVRPLGLPQPYEEGEMIAIGFDVDEKILTALRAHGRLTAPELFEAPPPCAPGLSPLMHERLVRSLHCLPHADAEALAEWLEDTVSGRRLPVAKRA